jgi:hypothetical protein
MIHTELKRSGDIATKVQKSITITALLIFPRISFNSILDLDLFEFPLPDFNVL